MKPLNWPNLGGGPRMVTTEIWDGEMWTSDTLKELKDLKKKPFWADKNYDTIQLLLQSSLSEIFECFDAEFNTIGGHASFILNAMVEGRWKIIFHFVRDIEGNVFDYNPSRPSHPSPHRVEIGVLTSQEMMALLERGLRECWRSEWNFTANLHYQLGHWVCIRKFAGGIAV